MIGALGGHLGLWIGMSLVSVVELLELLMSFCKFFVYKCQKNKTDSMTDLGYHGERGMAQTPVLSIKKSWLQENSEKLPL